MSERPTCPSCGKPQPGPATLRAHERAAHTGRSTRVASHNHQLQPTTITIINLNERN